MAAHSFASHSACRRFLALLLVAALPAAPAAAQVCLTNDEMEPAAHRALQQAAQRFFSYAANGDFSALKQNSIPAVASDFGGIESAVAANRENFSRGQAAVRDLYLLEAEGQAPLERAQFFCGVFNSPDRVGFSIPNLPPGRYGVSIMDVSTPKGRHTLSLILQEQAGGWQLAGFYAKPAEVGGHDGAWYWNKAREYRNTGQQHNAWLYYQTAAFLLAPVDFMGTAQLDRLYSEMQQARPATLPSEDEPVVLSLDGKSYRLTHLFAEPLGNDLYVVVKYQAADVSNTQRAFQDNMAVIRGLVARHPELRSAFSGVVARGVEPSGRDYGSLLAMKDVK